MPPIIITAASIFIAVNVVSTMQLEKEIFPPHVYVNFILLSEIILLSLMYIVTIIHLKK